MILWFSGTGNSEYAARYIAERTGDEALDLGRRIKHGDTSPLTSDRPWVIAAPTYCWRLPRIVAEHIAGTELRGDRRAYFVLTCGDDTGGAESHLRRLCRRAGLEYMGLAPVVMPENYIALFDAPAPGEARHTVAAASPALDAAAVLIAAAAPLPPKRAGLAGRIKSDIVNPFYYPLVVRDRKFRTTEACTGCGACAALCPLNNINIKDGRPVWRGDCTHCMACICRCPEGAIEYGAASVGRERYVCPKG